MKLALAFLAFLLTTSAIHASENDPCEWGFQADPEYRSLDYPSAVSVSDLKKIWDDPAPHNSCLNRCIGIYFAMFKAPFWYRDFVDSCTYYCAAGRVAFSPNVHPQGLCKSEEDLKTYYASSVALEIVWRCSFRDCLEDAKL